MLAQRRGRIINTASMASLLVPHPQKQASLLLHGPAHPPCLCMGEVCHVWEVPRRKPHAACASVICAAWGPAPRIASPGYPPAKAARVAGLP